MAGIGFRLEKILSKNSYLNLLEGYFYSAIVSSGPVLFTITTIAILSLVSLKGISHDNMMIFRTLVVYIYGATLITTSPAQMVITRYISDQIFQDDFESIVPSFVGISVISIIFHAIVGYIATGFLDLGFGTEIVAVVLFVNISMIWIAMIALSAAKEFTWILYSFAIGSIVSVLAGYFLVNYFGLFGLLAGFTLGQVILVTCLISQIFLEFRYRKSIDFAFLKYFKKYKTLGLIATFYNIGIWSDKIVFWFTPETNEHIHGFLYASYVYDVPIFIAYLFIIPSLALFTIRIETSFYIDYKKFFLAILNKHPLGSIEERRQNIISNLKISIGRMIVFQGTITVIGLIVAPIIYNHLKMEALHLGVFQIAILATFLQALMLSLLILILYFDFRTDALILAATFAVLNLTLSLASTHMGFAYYGYGYFSSCLISLIVGFLFFNYRLKNLLFYTFVSQKIVTHKRIIGETT